MRARRAELHDVFKQGDESVVMAGGHVVRLSQLATFLMEQMADWHTHTELAAALVQRFGEPTEGEAPAFVQAALNRLADLGIVEVEA